MKKVKKYILIEENKTGLTFSCEGFNAAEIVGILTTLRDDKIIEILRTKYITNEKPK
jgi:hypothetical protein